LHVKYGLTDHPLCTSEQVITDLQYNAGSECQDDGIMTTAPGCIHVEESGVRCKKKPVADTPYCWQHGQWFEADLEAYRMVDEHHRQDLREFWGRSNFYLLVQGGLITVAISGLGQALGVRIALTILGFILSLHWYVIVRASNAWARAWGRRFLQIEKIVDRHRSYYETEQDALRDPALSLRFGKRTFLLNPNVNAQQLPLIFAVAWLVLFVMAIVSAAVDSPPPGWMAHWDLAA
jgi:hypothetical protein